MSLRAPEPYLICPSCPELLRHSLDVPGSLACEWELVPILHNKWL